MPLSQSSAPSRMMFSAAPAADVFVPRFGSTTPPAAPYAVDTPTSTDRHSLGLAQEISDVTGDFLNKVYLAHNGLLDKALAQLEQTPHPRTQAEFRKKYEPVLELYRQFGAQGYLGMSVPAAYGGSEAGTLATVELARRLAYADLGACTTILASVGLFGEPILDVGTEAQKQKYLSEIISGNKIGAFGLTEPDAGSDPAALKTTAKAYIGADGQRHWKISGSKTFISNGNTADYSVILARTVDEHGQDRGLSGFIVHRDDAGFSTDDVGKKVGLHTSDTATQYLDEVDVPEERLIGGAAGIGKGKHIYNKTLTGGRIGVGAQGIGVAERALDLAIEYANVRKQGAMPDPNRPGQQIKLPIASYAQVRDLITRPTVLVEVSKALAYHAARMKDAGLPYSKLAGMTKVMGTELAAKEATDAAIQACGGMGFMEETKVGKLWRDARVLRIYEGTSQVQLGLIIPRDLVKEIMSGQSQIAKQQPTNDVERVDQAFRKGIQLAGADLMQQSTLYQMSLETLNAAQPFVYRLALIATEWEALLAYKAHVERLEAAQIPCPKEQAILRIYAADVAARSEKLVAEMAPAYLEDMETVAADRLGKSLLPRA